MVICIYLSSSENQLMFPFSRINDRLVSLNDANTRVKSLQDVELMWEQLEKSPVIQMVNVILCQYQRQCILKILKQMCMCVCVYKMIILFNSRLLKTLILCWLCREFGDGCLIIPVLRYTKSRLHFTTVTIRGLTKSYLPYI